MGILFDVNIFDDILIVRNSAISQPLLNSVHSQDMTSDDDISSAI